MLAIDLFCGLGGWAEGLLAEGWNVVGFDIERHRYGAHRYPAQLALQDVLTLHGSQFRDADLIVASPPCQEYSYMAMPWTRAKAKAAAIRADTSGKMLADLNRLFDTCFRLQVQASLAAGRHIPMVVENVRGAQPWVGRARWNFGSFYLWGDVPALMPMIRHYKSAGMNWSDQTKRGQDFTRVAGMCAKVPGFRFDGSGRSFQSASVKTVGHLNRRDGHDHTRHLTNPVEGVKQGGSGAAWWDKALDERRKEATAIKNGALTTGPLVDGFKGVNGRSAIRNRNADPRPSHGDSPARKAASAMIAKIPLPLARHVGRVFKEGVSDGGEVEIYGGRGSGDAVCEFEAAVDRVGRETRPFLSGGG